MADRARPGTLGGGHLPTPSQATLAGWSPPGHGSDRASCCCSPGEPSLPLERGAELLTAEPGFMGVAAGRGVSMWPPCKERQKRVSLGRASPSDSCLHRLWSHHIPVRPRLLSAAAETGPWEEYSRGQGARVWAQSFGAAGGKRGEGEQGPEQTLAGTLGGGRPPLGACLRSRKEREGE